MTDNVDKALLKEIASGAVSYVSPTQGQPMLALDLIEINSAMPDPTDPTKVATRITPKGTDYLAQPASHTAEASKYTVLTGVELPAAKRRGNHSGSGAPTKYPFDSLPVGGVFFSGNSEHKKNDAVKALGSTVSAQNNKYSEPVMGADGKPETKTVTRAVRDKKTHKAVIGADGKKETETVSLPVKNYTRKFTIRPVEAGYKSGDWVAPEAGALIGRVK